MRREGREPMGLGAAIGVLVTERAWALPAAGASLRERWATIAPDLAGHVVAVGFDADSGRLTVCPESSAWATTAPWNRPGSSRPPPDGYRRAIEAHRQAATPSRIGPALV
ncbi:DciA family protein [Streptomyces sp. NPDC005955]|uniref:DUF721 domain-containing protein n=1 Tax=Streptomyces sp. NPDC005955 TaxID=3364738 RepID=UPI0036A42142